LKYRNYSINPIKLIFYTSLSSFLGITGYFCFISEPIVLQKTLSIKAVKEIDIFNTSYGSYTIDEINSQIKAIPYTDNASLLYTINPRDKLKETIYGGKGTCSELVFGASIFSLYKEKKSAPIHMLPYDGRFLKGGGHTLKLIRLEDKDIVVDYLEGGFPLKCGNFINLQGLKSGPNGCDIGFLSVNYRKDNVNNFVTTKSMNENAIGILSQLEVDRYHRFLETIHIPLFNKRLEKIVFDSIAMFTGNYPSTYVEFNDWKILLGARFGLILIAKIWIYSFWISFLLLIYFSIIKAVYIMNKK
tara:strand:- start:140 stop:1045 length:906 start_codon:yes stop_codon:yes gene_type:complete